LYFSGLSLRKTSEHLLPFVKRIMFQYEIEFNSKVNKAMEEEKKVSGFIVDETLIKVGRELVWLWIAIEPIEKVILLDIRISFERSILVAERFFKS
jgi:transposase-like protein